MSGRNLNRFFIPAIWMVGSWVLLMATVAEAADKIQQQIMAQAMKQRPNDPWPRGAGHVVLALPGSSQPYKAYHEPGGSFSPAVGSFGVSFWLTDTNGAIQATSDNLPLEQCRQQWIWPASYGMPSLLNDTSFYQATWSSVGPGRWQLQLQMKTNVSARLSVVIRSVGPAGGPVSHLDWNGQRLLINRRWTLTCDPLPATVHLGREDAPQWITLHSTNRQVSATNGWGFARLVLPDSRPRRIRLHDSTVIPPGGLAFGSLRAAFDLSVPSEPFTDCLHAQVAHLLMGLVGRETRPGDPTYYPFSWLREGAYITAALACAGQTEVARQLATILAEIDFFGGDGPEADHPGLALWALNEVSNRLGHPRFDRLLWPHIARKAGLIIQMRSSGWPIFKPVVRPILPQHANRPELTLVAEAARNGLIMGKVDWDRPTWYVNAMSYRGLLSAAEFAERLGEPAAALLWRNHAAALKLALAESIGLSSGGSDRAFTCGLWPTWAASDIADYAQNLSARWDQKHDKNGLLPDRLAHTAWEIAETHQWLCLGQPNQVWDNLQWFWDYQASPELYTWPEGRTVGENPASLWERVRGWVNPPHVTPHYGAAAQMLLLQLDMLASVDESGTVPVLVVGAGVPYEWLVAPMHVRGLLTRVGRVDWFWASGKMQVTIRGQRCPVRLGPSFPADTPLVVRY